MFNDSVKIAFTRFNGVRDRLVMHYDNLTYYRRPYRRVIIVTRRLIGHRADTAAAAALLVVVASPLPTRSRARRPLRLDTVSG